jgi:kynurenine formamidase
MNSSDEHIAALRATRGRVSKSPFGSRDEIGMLNLVTAESRFETLRRADASTVFDLSVELFLGMPSATSAGGPPFEIWMSHTPAGTVIDDQTGVGPVMNRRASFSGDCLMMYTHCGTHIDTLNHFGYDGVIWNEFDAASYLGSRHWMVAGADKLPPIIARGVLIDVAAAHDVVVLPERFGIGEAELRLALGRQHQEIRVGDVVLVRTGRMSLWPDVAAYLENEPGLNRDGAAFLARSGAILIGSDNLALEQVPADDSESWLPVHTYLLAEAGVPIMEVANLEELSAEGIFQFAFVGASIKIRGATGAPIRPIAMPLRAE